MQDSFYVPVRLLVVIYAIRFCFCFEFCWSTHMQERHIRKSEAR